MHIRLKSGIVVADEHIEPTVQRKLAGVALATYYDIKQRQQQKVDEAEFVLRDLLETKYTRHQFYSS